MKVAAYETYARKGFTIVGVSIDTGKARLKVIEKDKITTGTSPKDNTGKVYQRYGITSIRANFLIDPTGTVIAKALKAKP